MSEQLTLAAQIEAFDKDFESSQQARVEQLQELDEEIARIEEALRSLQSQLQQLTTTKGELETAGAAAGDRIEGGNALLFQVLSKHVTALVERNESFGKKLAEQQARVAAAAADEVGLKLVEDVRKFEEETLPVLDHLPESYRPLLLQKHEETKAQLKAHLDAALGEPVEVQGEGIHIDVAYAIDAPEGMAELVTLIIPVPPSVQVDWEGRNDDLLTQFAARAVQGVYQAFRALGLPAAQCFFGEHHDMLVVEAELPEGNERSPEQVQAEVDKAMSAAFAGAAELQRARVEATPYRAATEYLLPPVEGELEEDEVPQYA
jgi:chaperonin cofactor prefoldin